jgi:hypothetical protein
MLGVMFGFKDNAGEDGDGYLFGGICLGVKRRQRYPLQTIVNMRLIFGATPFSEKNNDTLVSHPHH